MNENQKFAGLDNNQIEKINKFQHEIMDNKGHEVILVAYDKECGCGKDCHC